jgi:hypothetical protein
MKVSEAEVIAALRKNRGILGPTADDLGITRQSLYERVDASPELQRVRAEIDELILDKCEVVIFDAAETDKGLTARWLAERKGKHRGYGNQVQATLDEKQLEAFVFAFGGDENKLRALRDTLNPEKSGK